MKYTLIFILFSVVLIYASIGTGSIFIAIPLANTSLAFLWVGLAYGFDHPSMLMKKNDGTLHPLSWPILWPFYLLNESTAFLARKLGRESRFDEIIPGLYLGRRLVSGETQYLKAEAVVDLTSEFPESADLRNRIYLFLPVLDARAPSLQQLQAGVDWMASRYPGTGLYVHCALGHGRSATLAVAFLLHVGHVNNIGDGVALVKNKRPGIGLHPCQMAILKQFHATRIT